ncbi:unnamed protein product, partial [Staurois parvus]
RPALTVKVLSHLRALKWLLSSVNPLVCDKIDFCVKALSHSEH